MSLVDVKECFHCGNTIAQNDVTYVITKTIGGHCGRRWIGQPGKNINEEIQNMNRFTILFHVQCFEAIAGETYNL